MLSERFEYKFETMTASALCSVLVTPLKLILILTLIRKTANYSHLCFSDTFAVGRISLSHNAQRQRQTNGQTDRRQFHAK